VWWLLMSVGVLLTFATFLYGGGYMIFAAWVVLTRLGLYVHGLFSEELLEWAGALIIAIGIGMLAFRLNYTASQWVTASTLGVGLPILAAMLDRGRQRAAWVRLAQSAGWILCVLMPPLLTQRLANASVSPNAPVVSLDEFRKRPATQQIAVLPAGSIIPVKVEVSGVVFRASNASVLPLVLNEPIEIEMNNGLPTRKWRFAGESWEMGTRNALGQCSMDQGGVRSAIRAGDTHAPARRSPSSTHPLTDQGETHETRQNFDRNHHLCCLDSLCRTSTQRCRNRQNTANPLRPASSRGRQLRPALPGMHAATGIHRGGWQLVRARRAKYAARHPQARCVCVPPVRKLRRPELAARA
jgi:hypothetical protein